MCYICLDGEDDGKSSKLMRACACRGNSAGFVHLECLAKLAISKEEASGDYYAVFAGWLRCGNCKQSLRDALALEMTRRCWRRHRSSQDLGLRYNSTRALAVCLGAHHESDAANQLLDEASTCAGDNMGALLGINLLRAELLIQNGQLLEALGRLQAMLPEAKVYTGNPSFYRGAMQQLAEVLLSLGRNQEAHEMATEAVAFSKAKWGPEDPMTLEAVRTYAAACAMLDRVEEAKVKFEEVLTAETRVLGHDHDHTQKTRRVMHSLGFAVPSG